MSCCNKAPHGGGKNPKVLLKVTGIMFAIIFLIAFLFG